MNRAFELLPVDIESRAANNGGLTVDISVFDDVNLSKFVDFSSEAGVHFDLKVLGELPSGNGFVVMLTPRDTACHFFVPAVNNPEMKEIGRSAFKKLRREVNEWLQSRVFSEDTTAELLN